MLYDLTDCNGFMLINTIRNTATRSDDDFTLTCYKAYSPFNKLGVTLISGIKELAPYKTIHRIITVLKDTSIFLKIKFFIQCSVS